MISDFRVRSFPPIRQKNGEWMGHGDGTELNGQRPSRLQIGYVDGRRSQKPDQVQLRRRLQADGKPVARAPVPQHNAAADLSASKTSTPACFGGRTNFFNGWSRQRNFRFSKAASPALPNFTASSFPLNWGLGSARKIIFPSASRAADISEPTLTKQSADCRSDSIKPKSGATPASASCDCKTRRWMASGNSAKTIL